MNFGQIAPSARAAWILLAGTVVLAVVLASQEDLRSAGLVGAGISAIGMILVGVRVHRPGTVSWLLVALMVTCWTSGALLVHLEGHITAPAVVSIWAGQAVATGVILHAMLSGNQPSARWVRSGPDLLLVATVLILITAQILTGASGRANLTAVLVSSVDVLLFGMLVWFGVTRRIPGPSLVLVLGAAFLAIAFDLCSAVHGRRLALPGEPSQALGAVVLLMFGIAALHPSMTQTFSAQALAQRRRPSTSLLGLLPLVLVPSGVSWVAGLCGARSLPRWSVLAAGATIAGLCLLRGSAALRSSEYLAEHDGLTDLANRRGLTRAFDQAGTTGGLSLLLLDVDEFKQVNDAHGHEVGDALLLRLRDRLLRTTGEPGLAARLGGDEFAVLTRTDRAAGTAAHLLHLLADPLVIGDLVLQVGVSIGIADAWPGSTLAEVLTHADVAMYAAKAAGGAQALTFHPEMRAAVARRLALTGQVRQLLGADNPDVGHLEMRYQPLVDLRSGQVVGAEGLVRWSHPELGLLAPDAFLGLVSSNHLDAELDAAVLRAVLGQLAAWREEGLRVLPVSVNLTRDSLDDPRLAERVLGALSQHSLPASLLHLEITEHHQLAADSPAEHTLETLDAAGVQIYLDDYGTGYTSLEYLLRFPVRLLKLDRSVVTPLSGAQIQLVAAVNTMAVSLGLGVLAEGIETEEQRDQLIELGIQFGQGYLFARPLPAAEYARTALGITAAGVVPA